jgi:hypothetical protein
LDTILPIYFLFFQYRPYPAYLARQNAPSFIVAAAPAARPTTDKIGLSFILFAYCVPGVLLTELAEVARYGRASPFLPVARQVGESHAQDETEGSGAEDGQNLLESHEFSLSPSLFI